MCKIWGPEGSWVPLKGSIRVTIRAINRGLVFVFFFVWGGGGSLL